MSSHSDCESAFDDFHYKLLSDWERCFSPVAGYIHHSRWMELHVLWDEAYATKLKELIKKYPPNADVISYTFPGMTKRPCVGITLYFVGETKVALDILMNAYKHNDDCWLFDDLKKKNIDVNRETLRQSLDETRDYVLSADKE